MQTCTTGKRDAELSVIVYDSNGSNRPNMFLQQNLKWTIISFRQVYRNVARYKQFLLWLSIVRLQEQKWAPCKGSLELKAGMFIVVWYNPNIRVS